MVDYSLEKLASEIEFDIEDYSSLLELFIDTTYSNLAEISSAVKIPDNEVISSNIHNIKGASLNLGLDKITVIVGQMSKLNKAGVSADIEAIVNECKAELIKLRNILE